VASVIPGLVRGRRATLAALLLALAVAACGQGRVSTPTPEEQAGAPTGATAAPVVIAPPTMPLPATAVPAQGPVKVGLLLPLSGPNGGLGQALLQAAQMALFDLGDARFTLVVRDTEGPGGVPAAAQQLVQERAGIVLGPIFAAAVGQAAPAVRAGGVPMVTFSTDVSVAGNGVYVMGVLPGLQVERVVGYAASKGYRRVAALAPSTAFGQTITAALQTSAPRFGAAVVQVDYYDPAAADMSEVVQRLNPGGVPQFDALMLPEGAPRLTTIAPLVPYFDIDTAQVRLLGTALWDDPSLAAEPALIGGWFAAPQPEQWNSFAARYRALYRSDPPRIASLAYDATALAAVLGRAEGGAGFGLEALTNPSGFSGVDGVFRFRPDGRVERGLAVFEMQSIGPVVIDPAPTSFEPAVF
jgi:ABC-type branched-subunit amino acid transport system substrate-binding protein